MTAPQTTTAISAYGLAISRALQASGADSAAVNPAVIAPVRPVVVKRASTSAVPRKRGSRST